MNFITDFNFFERSIIFETIPDTSELKEGATNLELKEC